MSWPDGLGRQGRIKGEEMRRRPIGRLAALLACCALGIGAALPASGIADRGGVPHHGKPCKVRAHGNGPKHPAPNSHGRKCGFHRTAETPPPVDDGTDDGVDDGTDDGVDDGTDDGVDDGTDDLEGAE
jgi:hypothetical protein